MNAQSPWHGMFAIVLIGSALGLGYNALSPKPLNWIAKPKTGVSLETLTGKDSAHPPEATPSKQPDGGAATDPFTDIPAVEFPIEIDLAKAKELYDRGIKIVDARDLEEYVEGHIRGATATPYNEIAGELETMEALAATPGPILVYCGGGNCELSMDLAFELNSNGHRRTLVFMGGFAQWKEAGYPMESGGGR